MSMLFTCPHCGIQTRVDDGFVGQTGPCFGCGKRVTVTNASSPAAAPRTRPPAAVLLIVVVAITSFLALVMTATLLGIPAVRQARDRAARGRCSQNLQQIVAALQAYHDRYDAYPPAVVNDVKGRPMHSWRVLILPFLGHASLYQQYDLSQPWDSQQNMALLGLMPAEYGCPSDPDAALLFETSYLVVRGEGTAFPGTASRSRAELQDHPATTILVIEQRTTGIGWLEPRDAELVNLTFRVSPATGGISSSHLQGAHVGMADGTVAYLDVRTPPEYIEAMLSIAGQERVPAAVRSPQD